MNDTKSVEQLTSAELDELLDSASPKNNSFGSLLRNFISVTTVGFLTVLITALIMAIGPTSLVYWFVPALLEYLHVGFLGFYAVLVALIMLFRSIK